MIVSLCVIGYAQSWHHKALKLVDELASVHDNNDSVITYHSGLSVVSSVRLATAADTTRCSGRGVIRLCLDWITNHATSCGVT